MIRVKSKHPPGTIGYWTAWHPRYWQFLDSLTPLQVPEGSQLMRVEGNTSAGGCNRLIKEIVGDWLWLIPDDHTIEPDLLLKLLDREVDVVAPKVCRRGPPFDSVAFKEVDPTGNVLRWDWQEIAQAALENRMLPCQALGAGGLLLRRHVFDKIEKPYFAGGLPEEVSDDIDFTYRLHEAGVQLWLDTSVSIGHILDGAVEWGFGPDGIFGLKIHIMKETYWVTPCLSAAK